MDVSNSSRIQRKRVELFGVVMSFLVWSRAVGVPRTTFYRWYNSYLQGGLEALEDRPPKPSRVWNRIPDEIRDRIVHMALEDPDLSPRELAVRFTDTQAYFVSEASVYRLLKAHDLITSPAFVVIKANDEFRDKTTAPNQFWQTDFTYIKVIGWGWFYGAMSTEDKGQETPDFRCDPPDGKPFYVEVKTFDIVGGDARKRDMLYDGLDSKVELEEQIGAGKSVAMAESEIAPFRKAGETKTYDSRSLNRVIDTLREKSLGAFKEGQFKEGPTLALVVVDRLLLPGGKFDLAPYYYADFNDGGITSGVLWHMAYGRPGTPIFRLPEFAGANSLDSHLDRFGLFVDETRPFWGPGLVVLHRAQCGRRAYGLVNGAYAEQLNWSIDDTHEVLARVCHRWNDERASRSWDISADIGAHCGG